LKKKILLILIGAIAVTFAIIYIMPFPKTGEFVAEDYKFEENYHKELTDVPVMTQKTAYTCNVVSMAIVKSYLGAETDEDGIRRELDLLQREYGMLPNEYFKFANKAFEPLSVSVSIVNPTSRTEILNTISESLERDMPIVIFFSTENAWNKPHYDTHYAVVYGIDMASETVRISNPYGYLEELSFVELFGGLDFTNYKDEPFSFKLARKAGIVKSNTIFVFKR